MPLHVTYDPWPHPHPVQSPVTIHATRTRTLTRSDGAFSAFSAGVDNLTDLIEAFTNSSDPWSAHETKTEDERGRGVHVMVRGTKPGHGRRFLSAEHETKTEDERRGRGTFHGDCSYTVHPSNHGTGTGGFLSKSQFGPRGLRGQRNEQTCEWSATGVQTSMLLSSRMKAHHEFVVLTQQPLFH